MKLRFASMTAGLAVGLTAAVVAASALGAYLYSSHHFETQIETARATALAKGELIRVAFEHQMIENDRTLIARMIEGFSKQPRVDGVVLLDRYGTLRYSGGRIEATNLHIDSPTCQACHQHPPEHRESSRVIETRGGVVLRTVVPIRNRQECHRCHDAKHKINGILLLDYNVEEMRLAMTRDLQWMVAGTGAMTLLLVGALGLVVQVFVLRRLRRFETTARLIAEGDLNRRVPVQGSDTVSWLAREFNTMADSMAGLVGEVRHERERLETVINSIDDGIVVLDSERRILAANDAFLQRAGHSRAQALGCCCRDLGAGACAVTDCPSLACLRSGARQVRICERTTPEGAVAWEEVHASPVLDASGKLLQVVEVWRDISERRAAEARLAESHRLASLGLLASGFSHEMNTPLATVLMCVEGILREARTEENRSVDHSRIVDTASIAREQIMRCRGITQHFLRMSRNQKSDGELVDLPETIAAAGRLIDPTARAHSVMVHVHPVAPGLHIRADAAEFQHTLINILLNSIQACKPGGEVVVSVEVADAVHIRVIDNGCGIAPEHQKRIFEPFFSLRQGGTGLGLFLSLNFVRHWGGDIAVDSAPGRGSAFDIVLPALQQDVSERIPAA